MRIGFDAHVLDGRNQGTKTALLRLLEEAPAAYPEHDFFVYAEERHPDVDFSRPNMHFRQAHRSGAFSYLLRTMPQAARRDALDVTVFNYVAPPTLPRSAIVIHDVLPQTHPRLFPLPFVVQCWALFGASSLLTGRVFTVSDYSRRQIRHIYPWTRARDVRVLHQGPSFSSGIYAAAAPTSVPRLGDLGAYILCVGRIEPRKNVQMAIDAFRSGAPADTRLVLVGRREPGVAIDLHGDPRIVELAGLTDAELAAVYRGAALFLYPSAAEGFGIPLLDAILFGVPVISSDRTSMPEVGGDCATFFNPEEPGATEWLAGRIAGGPPGAPPPPARGAARAGRYGWAKAARELVEGLTR